MALPPVNVPNVPGVPAVIFPAIPIPLPVLLTADVAGIFQGFGIPTYGIFNSDGSPAIICDSVVTVDYRQEFVLATFPMEEGAFNTYDKVQIPYNARIRCATGGGPTDRQAFLESIDAIIGDINLYDIVTPDRVYVSANLVHQDYRREARSGAGLVMVDIFLEEVRVTGSSTTTSTQSNLPSSTPNYQPADPSSYQSTFNGTVQTNQGPELVGTTATTTTAANQGPELVGTPS